MPRPQIGEGDIAAHVAIHLEGHAALFQLPDAPHDDILLQLEARNAIGQQTAGPVVAVIDGHLHTRTAQHIRRRQAAGSRADDAHALGSLLAGGGHIDPTFLPGGVGDVFLDTADGDRAVARQLDHAIALAQAVLRADTATDFRKGICRLAQLIGLFQPPLGGQTQPVGDVVVQRAMALAIGYAALAAPCGLLPGLGIRVFGIDFVEILVALIGIPLLGHIPRDGYKLQHGLLGHGATSDKYSRPATCNRTGPELKVSFFDPYRQEERFLAAPQALWSNFR